MDEADRQAQQRAESAERVVTSGELIAGWPELSFEQKIDLLIKAAKSEARAQVWREAARHCDEHGKFCEYEANSGGNQDLRERANGAYHLGNKFRAMAEKEGGG